MNIKNPRLIALDALRGLIIVLMALDHANYFVAQQHSSGEYWGGPFPVYDNGLAFLTRLVTHLSAPGFFFLMGAGMALFTYARQKQGWTKSRIIKHFWIRGALLIGWQLLANLIWALSSNWQVTFYIGVLFALGGTMIIGSLFLWLKRPLLIVVMAVSILATEFLLPSIELWNQSVALPNRLMLIPGGDLQLWVNYPVLPWLGLVTLGIFCGRMLSIKPQEVLRQTLVVGPLLIVLFLILRTLGSYGNTRPQIGGGWIAFLNVVKYPPSLTFILLTMGVNLTILGLFARVGKRGQQVLRPLTIFGQVPLFFYITHLLLYALIGQLLTPGGTTIPMMYPFWLLGLLLLYPLCLWYGRFKHQTPVNSLWRFL